MLDESTLRRTVGDAGVMSRQTEVLMETASVPGNVIQVLTFDRSGGIGSAGSLTIFEMRDGTPMVGYMDANRGGRLVEDQQEAHGRMDFLNMIRVSALSPKESLEFMQEIRSEYNERLAQEHV